MDRTRDQKERKPIYCDHCGQPGAREGVMFGDGLVWVGPIYRLHYHCDAAFRKGLDARRRAFAAEGKKYDA